MPSVTTLPFRPDGWTVDDLDDLPDDGYRYELIDGALLVSPPSELPHQYLTGQLVVLLSAQLPEPYRAAPAPGLYFDPRNYRIPDVVVFHRERLAGGRLGPDDVLLAVEVVSPGSVRMDRVAKPAQYAAGGIAHLWRVELTPLELVTHELRDDVYRETGRYDVDVDVAKPVQLRFRLPDLLE
jgi:Uma2 family endonuclease